MRDLSPDMDQENGFRNFRMRREEQIRSACDNQVTVLTGTLNSDPAPKLVFFFGKRHCHSVEVILALAAQNRDQGNVSILVRHADVTTCAAVAQILCSHWHSESDGKLATTVPSARRIDVHLYEKFSNGRKPRLVCVTFFTVQVRDPLRFAPTRILCPKME
jgi:hypothetical protein